MMVQIKQSRWPACLKWVLVMGAVTLPGAGQEESGDETQRKIVPVLAKKDGQDKSARRADNAADLEKVRATETRIYISMFKLAPNHRPKYGHSGIGNLVNGFWIGELPLAEEQGEPILKLDDVVWGARVHSFSADIDYLEGNPADYRDYVARSNARRVETINHAQLMVTLGLLTGPQATFVNGRYLSGRWEELLQDMSMQEWFGITESQKKALEQIAEEAQRRAAPLPMLPPDPEERKRISAKYAAIRQETNADVMEILTPKQREMWDQLTTKQTLPAGPPDLPALPKAEAARINIEKLSPIFRVLANNGDSIKISNEQKKLLKDLKMVMRQGLFWISQRDGQKQTKPIAETRATFIKHAEQIALVGILTPSQAEMAQGLVMLSSGC